MPDSTLNYQRFRCDSGLGLYTPSEKSIIYVPYDAVNGGKKRLVLMPHGRAADATQWEQGTDAGDFAASIAEDGKYVVAAFDAAGLSTWGSDACQTAIANLVTYCGATYNTRTDRYAFATWSMGGIIGMGHALLNTTKVAAIVGFALTADYTFFHTTSAFAATFGPEIEAGFGGSGSWLANTATRDPARNYAGLTSQCTAGLKIQCVQGQVDTLVLPSLSTALVAGVAHANCGQTKIAGADHNTVLRNWRGLKGVIDAGRW